MIKTKQNFRLAFSIAELLITMLVVCVIAAAMVPVIGPKKVKAPNMKIVNGAFQCYWKGNHLYQVLDDNTEEDVTESGCKFTFPDTASEYWLTAIGSGGNGGGYEPNAGNDLNLGNGIIVKDGNGDEQKSNIYYEIIDGDSEEVARNTYRYVIPDDIENIRTGKIEIPNQIKSLVQSIPVKISVIQPKGLTAQDMIINSGASLKNGTREDQGTDTLYTASAPGMGKKLDTILWLNLSETNNLPVIESDANSTATLSGGNKTDATLLNISTKGSSNKLKDNVLYLTNASDGVSPHKGNSCSTLYCGSDLNLIYYSMINADGEETFNGKLPQTEADSSLQIWSDSYKEIKNGNTISSILNEAKNNATYGMDSQDIPYMIQDYDVERNPGAGEQPRVEFNGSNTVDNKAVIEFEVTKPCANLYIGTRGANGQVRRTKLTNFAGRTITIFPSNPRIINRPFEIRDDEDNRVLNSLIPADGSNGTLIDNMSKSELQVKENLQNIAKNVREFVNDDIKADNNNIGQDFYIPEGMPEQLGQGGEGAYPLIYNQSWKAVAIGRGTGGIVRKGEVDGDIITGSDNCIDADGNNVNALRQAENNRGQHYCKATSGTPGAVFITW